MQHLLLGGSGILGSGFRAVLARRGDDVTRLRPDWSRPASLDQALLALSEARGPVTLIWAAGAGAVGASSAAMAAETDQVRALCRAVDALTAEQAAELSVLFASSAGALFGGHGTQEVTEQTTPYPISPYGREKLVQEAELAALARRTGARVLACRYSNLYGLADGVLTPRGLVSTAVRATRLRQPMTVFVSPDTRRDLVFNEDAAALSLELLDEARPGFSARLVRDGTTRTVGEIVSVVGHVSGRRVPATYAERPETRLQPRVLRFDRPPRRAGGHRSVPFEAAVHLMMRAPMSR